MRQAFQIECQRADSAVHESSAAHSLSQWLRKAGKRAWLLCSSSSLPWMVVVVVVGGAYRRRARTATGKSAASQWRCPGYCNRAIELIADRMVMCCAAGRGPCRPGLVRQREEGEALETSRCEAKAGLAGGPASDSVLLRLHFLALVYAIPVYAILPVAPRVCLSMCCERRKRRAHAVQINPLRTRSSRAFLGVSLRLAWTGVSYCAVSIYCLLVIVVVDEETSSSSSFVVTASQQSMRR